MGDIPSEMKDMFAKVKGVKTKNVNQKKTSHPFQTFCTCTLFIFIFNFSVCKIFDEMMGMQQPMQQNKGKGNNNNNNNWG